MSDIDPITSPLLSAIPGVKHGFFTRVGGVSSGVYESLNVGRGSKDETDDVAENRRRAAVWFGAEPASLLTCYQIHSSTVIIAEGPWGDERPEGDGVLTARSGLVCGALSADCAPVLMVDPKARAVAAVHAGWKGALGGVVESALEALSRQFASRIEDVVAVVGPCIAQPSYEVGLEFMQSFTIKDPTFEGFFAPGETANKRIFNLPGFVLSRLKAAGVERCEWTGHDTYADEARFFSNRRAVHRGEGDYGRLLSAIALV